MGTRVASGRERNDRAREPLAGTVQLGVGPSPWIRVGWSESQGSRTSNQRIKTPERFNVFAYVRDHPQKKLQNVFIASFPSISKNSSLRTASQGHGTFISGPWAVLTPFAGGTERGKPDVVAEEGTCRWGAQGQGH